MPSTPKRGSGTSCTVPLATADCLSLSRTRHVSVGLLPRMRVRVLLGEHSRTGTAGGHSFLITKFSRCPTVICTPRDGSWGVQFGRNDTHFANRPPELRKSRSLFR